MNCQRGCVQNLLLSRQWSLTWLGAFSFSSSWENWETISLFSGTAVCGSIDLISKREVSCRTFVHIISIMFIWVLIVGRKGRIVCVPVSKWWISVQYLKCWDSYKGDCCLLLYRIASYLKCARPTSSYPHLNGSVCIYLSIYCLYKWTLLI